MLTGFTQVDRASFETDDRERVAFPLALQVLLLPIALRKENEVTFR